MGKGSSETPANNPNRKRGSHRRKSSSSSFGGDSLRRRKRMDTESSSLSLFEPLQVDVSTPSTNTVILTPSKITIEHSNDYEGNRDKKSCSNGRNQSKRNRYVSSSPIQWSYAHHQDEVNVNNDHTDFIEIVSEPEELCRSHSAMGQANTSKAMNARAKNNGYDTPKKPTQCDESNAFSIWERATDNDERERTIIFHHKSDVSDKCCDNYCPRNTESDTELEINADRSFIYTKMTDNEDICSSSTQLLPLNDKQMCCTSMSSLELLNNSMPSSSAAGSGSGGGGAGATTNSMALANFQKNNISQTGSHRYLDLSSDIRRYSKITNFELQNASNLLPNYLSRSSNTNLNESSTANGTSFELFNIPSTSMYDKPFGSINLTMQNHFESQSSSSECALNFFCPLFPFD